MFICYTYKLETKSNNPGNEAAQMSSYRRWRDRSAEVVMTIIPPLARRVFYYKEVTVVSIPLDVEVRCADGVAGNSITTVVNPVTKEVTFPRNWGGLLQFG